MKIEISSYTSDKLRILSFVCAVLVVVQHSFAQATFMQSLTTQSLTRIAVPFFFLVSGFLLYKDFDVSAKWASHKVLSRCRTLLVPYFVWTLISLVVSHGGGADFSSIHGIMKTFGIISAAPTTAGHLWYVRLLFLYAVFAVPIGLAVKYLRWTIPFGALFVFIVLQRSTNWSSLCWFLIGSMLALCYPAIINKRMPKRGVAMLLLLSITLILVRTSVFRGCVSLPCSMVVFTRLTEALLVCLLVPAVWFGYDLIPGEAWKGHIGTIAKSSFFLYCSHVYIYRLFPVGVFWCVRSAATIVLCVTLYFLLSRFVPKAKTLFAGGR